MSNYEVRFADLIYSEAASEHEKRVARENYYKNVLFLVHSVDIGAAAALILFSCNFVWLSTL